MERKTHGAHVNYLIVFLGGGIGATMRYGVNVAFGRWFGTGFPFHTLVENVSGSLVMGLLAGYFAARTQISLEARLFLTTGILGGYTTFSAFSLDSVLLWERGQMVLAITYVLASVAASIGALVLALLAIRHLV